MVIACAGPAIGIGFVVSSAVLSAAVVPAATECAFEGNRKLGLYWLRSEGR